MIRSQKHQKSKNIESIYALSPIQEGLLFHTLYAPNSGVDIEQILLTFSGQMNAEIFKQSWQQLLQRHGALRTLFLWEGRQQPLQVVKKQVDLPWSYLDWQNISPMEQQQKLEAFLKRDRNQGFQLNKAPLMRFTLIRLANQTYKFIWTLHHILMDGWCFPIILKEVTSYYQSSNQGQRCNLLPVRPYKDYIIWLQQQDLEGAEGFWRKTLQGFTTPTPLVVEKRQQQELQHLPSYQHQQLTLGGTTANALKSFARQYRLTTNVLVQAAWALLLNRYSGDSDVLFGVTVSGRPANLSGVEKMVGLFINTLPLGVKVTSKAQLIPWLQQLKQKQLQLQEYSYSSLTKIKLLSEIPGRLPLFESILAFENYPFEESLLQINPDLQIVDSDSFSQTNYPLALLARVTTEDFILKISYDTSRFAADTIARMLRHLQTSLEGMVANPNIELGRLPLLTDEEQQQLLVEWNNTKTDYPKDKCIHQLFEEQVEKNPDAVAVVFEEQKLTYCQLNSKANQLAHHLQTLGVKPETLVGICVERSVEMVVGILAILKVGGAYVPLDPNYPTSRLNYMVEDAQLSMILTQEKWQHHLSDTKASVICLDTDSEIINQQSQQRPENQVTANQLAYVIYTSGSTGQPKGVTIPHQGVVRLFSNTNYVQLDSTDRVAQVSNTSFDAATFEIWGALLHGAVVVVITKSVLLSPQEFVNYIKQEKITTLFLTTALFNQLAYSVPEAFSTLKYLLFGGEAVDTRSVKQVLEKGAPERLLHVYGPTENTTFSSWYKVTKVAEGATNLPIGKPISNTQIYILDSQLQPVPIGVSGELHIGGDGLAVGYHNRPELTASKFIPNPFENSQFKSSATPRRSQTQGNAHQEGQKSKLYKTGDLARYLGDGNIEFLGRIDHQVKIRGYRIETGEIEATLTQHPSVKQTVVVAREDNSGAQGLVAYIVPENESSLISNPELSNTQINSRQNLFNQQQESTQDASLIPQIRQFLKQKLPEYMIPAAFILLDAFPLTLNGKIDRRALPVPDTVPVALSTTYVMPITETEQLLAKIWQGVLQVEKVGIYDNFFELGGHSLLIIKVHTKLQEIYAQDISIVKLFQYPNISEFSKYLIDLETEKVTDTLTTGQAKARSDRKTSMKQQRLQRQQNRRNK